MGISWRFCLVLACSVVVSRPSATIRTGSLDAGWWGTEAAKQLLRAARQQIVQGNYAAAERIFADGAADAKHRGDRISAARLLSGVGAARMARFDFQGALEANVEAKHTAESAGDWLNVCAIDLNLASLYEQVWDLDAALRAAEEGRAALNKSTAYYKGPLLLEIARLHAERRDLDPTGILFEAVEAAHSEQEPAIEARAWSQIGSTRITRGDLSGAEDAFVQAYYLRRMFMPRDLGLSYSELGALRLLNASASPDAVVRSRLLDQAENFTALAAMEDQRGAVSIPGYDLQQQRGRIKLLRGDIPGALNDLSAAVESASRWRPGMASAELQAQSMEQFIEAAADYGIQTRNPKWIAASFLAEEATRDSNLKDNASLIEAWRRKLPARFWSTLAELRAEEDRLRRVGISHGPQSDRLRLELISMEAQAGFGLKPEKNREIFSPEHSLIHYQRVLGNSAVLLSFALGEKQSFLWALTGSTLNLYRLPARVQIAGLVREFRQSLQAGRPEAQSLARELYAVLFDQLTPVEASRAAWRISPADELLQMPFAALLPSKTSGHGPTYLAELHSVTLIPGALSLGSPAAVPGEGRFLAVGDPIYNVADPRWQRVQSWFGGSTYAQGAQLNRLPGSGTEVKLSARVWGNSTILEGVSAVKDQFLKQLTQSGSTPAVIHLATHVLAPSGGTNEAFVAFGINAGGQPELLGASEIAQLRVPGSLVVMSGCDSAGGDVRAGVGIENLTRAWTLAGARAVVATLWPVPDSEGEFLAQFYNYLRVLGPAQALRRAQTDAIHSGVASAVPGGWASYQVYGGMQ